MALSPEDLFRKAAGKVFNGWSALQLAVEHGMGGAQSHVKAMNMIESVVELFKNKPNADWDEVADMLGDMMDDEFNTICEDDSTDEVGTLLWEFYKICISGDNDLVEAEIAKLPSGNHWLSKCLEQTSNRNNSNAQVDSDSESEDEAAGTSAQSPTEGEQMETQDPDPGWTQVGRRKK